MVVEQAVTAMTMMFGYRSGDVGFGMAYGIGQGFSVGEEGSDGG